MTERVDVKRMREAAHDPRFIYWRPLIIELAGEVDRLREELSVVDQDLGEAMMKESTQWKPLLAAAKEALRWMLTESDLRTVLADAIAACEEKS